MKGIIVGIVVLVGIGMSMLFLKSSTTLFGALFEKDAPVAISQDVITEDNAIYQKKYVVRGSTIFPDITTPTYLIGDIRTGQIIASKQRDLVRPIASLTKLMTAVVADEMVGLSEEATVSRGAVNTYGNAGRLSTGDVFSIEELLYPLLLESSNDAAEVIAEHGGRDIFLTALNEKAGALGMENTFYADPSGLSAENVSSVKDLFALMQYIGKFRNYILDITTMRRADARGTYWYTNSRFINYPSYVGGKNGYTDEAGKTNLALFRLPLEGDEQYRDIAVILFDTTDAERDTRKITNYLNQYVYYE